MDIAVLAAAAQLTGEGEREEQMLGLERFALQFLAFTAFPKKPMLKNTFSDRKRITGSQIKFQS